MLSDGFLHIKKSLTIIKGKNGRLTLVVSDTRGYESKYIINDTAAEIIQYLGSDILLSVAVTQLAKKYGTTDEEINRQIVEFLCILESEYGVPVKLVHDFQEGNRVEVLHINELHPLGAFIEITDSCNLKCIHCYGGYDNRHTEYMSLENFKRIADQLNSLNVISLELSGGEITFHPNLIDIVKYAISLNFSKIGLLTNGLLLKDEVLDLICANKERFNIQIDLHGLTDEYLEWFMGAKHLLEPIMRIIKKVAKWAPYFRVATIVTKKNLFQIEEIADWLQKCGVKCYGLSLVVPLGRALECGDKDLFLSSEELYIFENIIEKINKKYPDFISLVDNNPEKKNCGCLTNCMAIQVNGEIKLCSMDSGTCLSSSFGNVLTESIATIYKQHQTFIAALENTEAPQPDAKVCQDCVYFSFCASCLLRAFIMAKRLGRECKWFETISSDVQEYII